MLAWCLSAVFLTAAAAKMLEPWSFRLTVRELLPTTPYGLAVSVAMAVPVLEAVVAFLFIAGGRPAGLAASLGSVALSGAFAAAFLLARRRPTPVRCRCFGPLGMTAVSGATLVTAFAIATAALAWTVSSPPLSTFPSVAGRLLAVLPAFGLAIHHLTRPRRRARERGAAGAPEGVRT